MKIVLVYIDMAYWKPGIYIKNSVLEPYSIECLGAALEEEDINVTLLLFDRGTPSEIAQTILHHNSNIVGFSVLTRSFNVSREVAREIKTYSPDTLVIFGGPHPSTVPDVVRFEEIDIAVIGEGEKTLIEIVKAFEKGEPYEAVKGIAYWNNGLKANPPQPRIEKLDSLPWPIRNREWLRRSKVALPIYPPQSEQNGVAQITYSRGCPFSCTFCCSPRIWGRRTFWRSAEEVMREVKYLKNNFDVNLLFFTDLTFNLSPSKVYELCDLFLKQKEEINWTVNCRFLKDTPPDLFKIMAKAGCSRIAWGLESVSNLTLSKVGKQQSLELASALLEASNRAGIINRVFLIIGFPWETKEELLRVPEVLKGLPIDSLRVALFTPFPGTPLWDQLKSLFITENLDCFTTDEPVLSIGGISKEALLEIRGMILRKFYNSMEYELHWRAKVRKFPHLKKAFDEFFEFLHKYKVLE